MDRQFSGHVATGMGPAQGQQEQCHDPSEPDRDWLHRPRSAIQPFTDHVAPDTV
jgi:hypothetical protein